MSFATHLGTTFIRYEGVSVKRSNRLVILVGVLLAVLAFVGIVILLNQGTVALATTRIRPSS